MSNSNKVECSNIYPIRPTEDNTRTGNIDDRKVIDIYKPRIKMEESNMDDLLQKYIEKVDRDQSDLRSDIRESEKRIREDSRELEKRMDNRLDRIEDMIKEQNESINNLGDKVSTGLRENKNFMWGITITVILSIIASIGVIVATYQSTISLIQNMIAK